MYCDGPDVAPCAIELPSAEDDRRVDVAGEPLRLDVRREEIAARRRDELLAAIEMQVVADDARQPRQHLVVRAPAPAARRSTTRGNPRRRAARS